PTTPLTESLADAWIDLCRRRAGERPDKVSTEAERNWTAEKAGGNSIPGHEFVQRLRKAMKATSRNPGSIQRYLDQVKVPSDRPINRAEACELIYAVDRLTHIKP